MHPRALIAALATPLAVLVLAACGSDDDSSSTSTPAAAAATTTTTADACARESLDTVADGKLTIGTDKPAYPPYFVDDDPTNGKGFESATAFAIAKQLGFSAEEVNWKVVPFNSSFAPGPKKFDFDINQVSINDKRKKAVDFSAPYFSAPQAVILPKGSTLQVSSLADLKDVQFGVQIGTTSLDAVQSTISPSKDPKVFDDSNGVVQALKNKQVQAVVVDLPTAFYLTSAEVEGAKIVGQFNAPGGDEWGVVLEKGSSLTQCVTKAVEALKSSGEQQKIYDRWLGDAAGAPELR